MYIKINDFEYEYHWRYLLTHPWVIVRSKINKLRQNHWRKKYGFCPYDTTSLDDWFCVVLSNALTYLAINHWGFPGSEPFTDNDTWTAWLWSMRDKILQCREEYWENQNEYSKQYEEEFESGKKPEKETISKFCERAIELERLREDHIKKTFAELAEHFPALWD